MNHNGTDHLGLPEFVFRLFLYFYLLKYIFMNENYPRKHPSLSKEKEKVRHNQAKQNVIAFSQNL